MRSQKQGWGHVSQGFEALGTEAEAEIVNSEGVIGKIFQSSVSIDRWVETD